MFCFGTVLMCPPPECNIDDFSGNTDINCCLCIRNASLILLQLLYKKVILNVIRIVACQKVILNFLICVLKLQSIEIYLFVVYLYPNEDVGSRIFSF